MSRADAITKSPPIPAYRRRWLFMATALLILALGIATGSVLFASYRDTMQMVNVELLNLSKAFATQTFTVVQAIEHVMLETEQGIPKFAPSWTSPQKSDDYNANHLAQHNLLGIYLYDTSGKLVAGEAGRAAPNPARREHSAIDLTPGKLRITIDQIDPATGRGVVSFIRDTVDAAGKPTGTIVVRASSTEFERAYERVQVGPGGSVALLNRDGTLLVRTPKLPSAVGTNTVVRTALFPHLAQSRSGTYAATSRVDGVPRLFGYSAIGTYPLVVSVAFDRDEALRVWYSRVAAALVFFALISMAWIFVAWRIARDARELAASEARAEKSSEYLKTILDSIGAPIWVLDGARKIVMYNQAFSRFIGRGSADLAGQQEADTLDRTSAAERDGRYRQVLEGAPTIEATTEMLDGGGQARTVIQLSSNLRDAAGQAQVVSVLTDITERRKAEERLAYLANFDLLTGLPNHVQFRRILEGEIAGAGEGRAGVGVLMVALTRMQEITDLLGNGAGEAALKQIGEMLQSLLPKAKCVARIRGSQFGVVVDTNGGRVAVEQCAIELLEGLSGPLRVFGREFYLGPVIGVSIFPEDGAVAEELIRRADSARSRADPNRGETIRFFSERAQTDLDERLRMEAHLRRAVERGELRLLYQPKIEIASGRIVGFEALVRWTSPELGEVSPVRFIPIAERTGLIVEIGAWILQEACRQIHRWSQAGAHVKVAVNLSPRQFHQKDLVPMIRQCLQDCAIDPGSLELEITETALMSHEQEVDALMHEIRALGVALSIDDFGTGYSSLAYLKRFPVQRLKVDRAFVHDLGKDADSAAIVGAVVSLARGLKLRVLAEGLETEEQLAILRSLACDEYQGFLFSRPVEADAVPALCAQNRAVEAPSSV